MTSTQHSVSSLLTITSAEVKAMNDNELTKYRDSLATATYTPIKQDCRNYKSMFEGVIEGNYVSAKDAFNFMLLANYETMSGKKRDGKSAKLFSDMFFYDMQDYSFLVVKNAFDRWRRNNNWLPTPADIIKLIDGVQVSYLADDYAERFVESSKKICGKAIKRFDDEIKKRELIEKQESYQAITQEEAIAIEDKGISDVVSKLTNNIKE